MKMNMRETIMVRAGLVPLAPEAGDGAAPQEALCVEVRIGGARRGIEASFFAVLPAGFEVGAGTAMGPVYEADPCTCIVSGWCERSGGVTLTCTIPAQSWQRFSA